MGRKQDKNHDLDETRRLLYMALAAPRTDRHELVGTLVNALAHHGSGLDPDDVMEYVIKIVNNTDVNAVDWARGEIERITAALEGEE